MFNPSQKGYYFPGQSVYLNCSAEGGVDPLVYQWSSTCSGNCFVLSQNSQPSISQAVLHSVDSGNHTCTVTDYVGSTDSAVFQISVVGE